MVIVKYVPFQSTAEPSFWMKLGEHKLNTIKLSEDPVPISASYTVQSIIKHRNVNGSGGSGGGRVRLDQDSIQEEEGSAANNSNTGTDVETNVDPDDAVFLEEEASKNDSVLVHGSIKILNTIESFKKVKKNELLNDCCLPGLMQACGITIDSDNLASESASAEEEKLDALTSLFCLCHLDLKSHKVVYWFAFPVLAPVKGKSIQYANVNDSANNVDDSSSSSSSSTLKPSQIALKESWGEEGVIRFHESVHELRLSMQPSTSTGKWMHPPFFIVVPNADNSSNSEHAEQGYKCLQLSHENYTKLHENERAQCKFAFLDPSSSSTSMPTSSEFAPVGWTLRNLIAYLTLKLGIEGCVQIISYRPGIIRRIDVDFVFLPDDVSDSSLLLYIQLPKKEDYQWPVKNTSTSNPDEKKFTCMGWELNARMKPGPRSINLAPLLSPAHLAQQATDLNLKLMKWRMIPNLDLRYLSSMKVLLLGAGTLGCSVARTLLGWGVRNFRFVDNGKVSYSNPVRQNLFEIQDCEGGGKYKAIAAAEALKRIAGSIASEGHVLTIPMPGHAFGTKEEESVRQDTEKMQELIDDADVVFLLTDTRESRWLPTVMARKSNKMMINAALGLDSWLVMRHGGNKANRLGCYFCNDVVAPENSTNNRTLDQQCTVTRPGLAPIASSMAVELCVSLLHHKERQDAPAPAKTAGSSSFSPTVQASDSTSTLGIMPHQIRGSIVSYTMMTPTVPAFKHCTGCCDGVVDTYKRDGFGFIRNVCNDDDGSYLEDVAGLTGFRSAANEMMDDCLDWDDEE